MEPLPSLILTVALAPVELTLVESVAHGLGLDVFAYASPEAFWNEYQPETARCLVYDLHETGEAGLAALDRLGERGIALPAILLANRPSIAMAVRAVKGGAVTLLEKPLTRAGIESALAEALREEEASRQLRRQREATIARLRTLTEGERAVLDRLMAGLANKNIAADLQLGLRTVELRRAKILKKLGAKSLAEMVRLVLSAEPDRTWGK